MRGVIVAARVDAFAARWESVEAIGRRDAEPPRKGRHWESSRALTGVTQELGQAGQSELLFKAKRVMSLRAVGAFAAASGLAFGA